MKSHSESYKAAGVDITAPGVAENLMKEKMGEAHVDG